MNQCDHSEINRLLGELLGLAKSTDTRLDTINGSLLRHDNEIKDINKWRNRLIGKMSAIGSVIGAIIAGIVFIFK